MPKRVAIVTGSNRGIGFATARALAARDFHVILATRDLEQGARARDRICSEQSSASVEALPLDLGSFASIRRFAAAIEDQKPRLQLLINNAGVLSQSTRVELTEDGFETTFATNYLGHFLLTRLLLDLLRANAPARVVSLSSQMHRAGVGPGKGPDFDFGNLRGERQAFDAMVAYRNAKLAVLWFVHEFARREDATLVTANAVCPGFVPATLADYRPSWLGRMAFRYIIPRLPVARTIEQAVGNVLFAATAEALSGSSGHFIVDQRLTRSSEPSYDEKSAARLWESSERWCELSKSADEGAVSSRSAFGG
jgi:NAD(P)-dependent dehydrogenase (short-subunit alcohol dehydrogenase family)